MEKSAVLIVLSGQEDVEKLNTLVANADREILLADSIADAIELLERQEKKATLQDEKGSLFIDLERRRVEKNGREIRLTPTEYKLFTMMARYPNRVFTREQLIAYALEDAFHGYDRSIDTYIKGLRKKLEDDRENPRYIQTVYGVGYRFVP